MWYGVQGALKKGKFSTVQRRYGVHTENMEVFTEEAKWNVVAGDKENRYASAVRGYIKLLPKRWTHCVLVCASKEIFGLCIQRNFHWILFITNIPPKNCKSVFHLRIVVFISLRSATRERQIFAFLFTKIYFVLSTPFIFWTP